MGVIFLLIHRMTASFGRLQNHTLELGAGLNILEAPNESGKSTWCAFLAAMLYGINSRERDRAGFIADKNRYAPWTGVAMSGRLDCCADGQELTLTRVTRRQTAPMGDFQAVYAGTGDAVPGLTGQACGETLLGVSREVYERSAFIRQAGLAISQDAGLERRIAALITSGEEDTSYMEAADAIKRQLNRRRHNKTGQLPALELQLQETQRQLAELQSLEQQLSQARAETESLESRVQALAAELAEQDRWDARKARQVLSDAQTAAQNAENTAAALRRELEDAHIPANDVIGRLRGAIVNLETVRRSVEKARGERDEAMKAVLRAEATVSESPFAGQTAESARREAAAPPKVHAAPAAPIGAALAGGAASVGVYAALRAYGPAAMAAAAVLLALTGLAVWALVRRGTRSARNAALLKRFGTADTAAIAALAEEYSALLTAREAAQAAASGKSAAADSLYASLSSNEQGILLEVRRFAPTAFDIPAADTQLRQCAVRRRELAEAETAAREARLRYEVRQQQAPAPADSPESVTPPSRSRDAVTAEWEGVQAALSAARSAADRLAGQLHAVGDPVVLDAQAQLLTEQITGLEAEYTALRLAMDTLDSANTALQNRFSPALGRRAAEIFGALTENRYRGVVLDRSFHLSAEPAGDTVYRDAALLSAGAADQLYLAVRLAICELVLPPQQAAPIVLDDALANFDDARCAAALRWLKAESKNRQILLFTCHSREAEFFAGDSEVSIRRLTEAV